MNPQKMLSWLVYRNGIFSVGYDDEKVMCMYIAGNHF